MLMDLFSLYRHNKYFTLPLYHITRPKAFGETLKFLCMSESWTADEMQQWQLKQLIGIVNYAFEHVPYYHEVYTNAGFLPGDLKTIQDFKLLPTVKKDDIKRNPEAFLSDEFNSIPKFISHTGGSTDKPMEFWLDSYMNPRENAYYEYYWRKFGFGYGDRCVVLRGNKILRKNDEVPFFYDRLLNHKIFDSSFVSVSEMASLYCKEIVAFKPKSIWAYPSVLYMLAKCCESQNIQAPTVDNVFLSSEAIYPMQADVIKRAFQVKNCLYSYGHSERVLLALKYPENNELGFVPQYGYVELLDTHNNDITKCGLSGEIVGTGWSRVMPFIRYRTGDFAEPSNYKSNDFMRKFFSVRRIVGRENEYVLLSDGRKLPLVNIAGAHLPSLSMVGDMQYIQPAQGELLVHVTSVHSNEVITENVLERVKNDLSKSAYGALNITVKQVSEIKRTKAGKKIMLISTINR